MRKLPIGFGVIGCGTVAPWHIEGILNIRNARLVGVADSLEERAKEVGARYKVRSYANVTDLLKERDIDVVSICTPSGSHGKIAIAAAEAGKHVLIEKPLEVTLEKVDELITACKKANVKLGAIFQRRFFDSTIRIKKAIDEGKFGKLVFGDMYCKIYRSQEYYDSGDWRGTWELDGGGVLMNQSIHGVDLLQYLMGPVESLHAYTDNLVRDIEVEDTAVVNLKFKNGALGVMEATTCAYPPQLMKVEIYGERGTVLTEGEDMDNIVKWEFEGEKVPERTKEKSVSGSGVSPTSISKEGHERQIRDIVEAIEEDREPKVNGEEGRKAIEIILAAYESAKTGKVVEFPYKPYNG